MLVHASLLCQGDAAWKLSRRLFQEHFKAEMKLVPKEEIGLMKLFYLCWLHLYGVGVRGILLCVANTCRAKQLIG